MERAQVQGGSENAWDFAGKSSCVEINEINEIPKLYDVVREINNYVEKHLETLDKTQKEIVRNLLLKYRKVFSNIPGCTNVYTHILE